MKKYIFMRILRSLVSIFLVTTLTYTIIYTLTPRNFFSIFFLTNFTYKIINPKPQKNLI